MKEDEIKTSGTEQPTSETDRDRFTIQTIGRFVKLHDTEEDVVFYITRPVFDCRNNITTENRGYLTRLFSSEVVVDVKTNTFRKNRVSDLCALVDSFLSLEKPPTETEET